jgi:NAD(P)-dependent dehydrogenase (short-subunit alcohol dehydrogenase family)
MAEICAFLCSPAARYINGAVIVADGGQSLANWSDTWDMEKA